MIKLTYSSDISSTVGVGGEIVKSASELGKQAATIFHMEYDEMKPPKGMTGIHLVALGDSEAYPMNRNGDLFPKEACVKYHPTFVKHGCVYQHHRNKDPKTQGIGQIKASAYNPDMHRIELYIWADNEKAREHLERLEKTGEVPFSMACFRAGTPILTQRGFVPIEKVNKGDEVLTHRGRWRTVTATMSRTAEDYYELSLVSWGSRKIELTGNHRVLAASFDDISRRYAKNAPIHPCKTWKRRHRNILHTAIKWKEASSLTSFDYLCVPIHRSTGMSAPEDVKWARMLGYYIAEGSLSGHGDTDLSVQLTCNVNDCFIEEIESLANWTSVSRCQHKLSDKAVIVSCFGKEPCRRIFNTCGRGCANKRIPQNIIDGTIEEKFNFVSAWFNGDGWQDKNGLHWSIKSPTLSAGLQVLLASIGVPSSCVRINHPENRGFIKSNNAYEHVVSVSNEYSELFSDISKATVRSVHGKSKLRTFISGEYMMVPVHDVKRIKKATKVYNLSVDGDESYTAYGLSVHNCRVPHDRCSVCGAIRERPGDDKECDHIKFELGKLAEDGTQIGTYNDDPTWFDISFVGRPADRIAWNLKVASSMPEDIKLVSSVKQAEVEGYTLPDDLAIESDISRRKLSVMKKLANCYGKCASWLSGETKPEGHDRYVFELRKLAGAKLDDGTLSMMRELPPKEAFSALGDAGVLMDVGSFFKYAFGPEYRIVEKYIPHVENAVSDVIKDAVDKSSCAEICNCSKFDPQPAGILARPVPQGIREALLKSAAAGGFGIYDATTNILEVVAEGREPSFYVNEKVAESTEVDPQVALKLAKRYAMYKVAGICAIMDGKCGGELDEDELVFVAAAQDLRK